MSYPLASILGVLFVSVCILQITLASVVPEQDTTTPPLIECCQIPSNNVTRCCMPGERCCNGQCYREKCTCCQDNCYLPDKSTCCSSRGACPPGATCCQKENSWPWCCEGGTICCPDLWGCCPQETGCRPKVCQFAMMSLGARSRKVAAVDDGAN